MKRFLISSAVALAALTFANVASAQQPACNADWVRLAQTRCNGGEQAACDELKAVQAVACVVPAPGGPTPPAPYVPPTCGEGTTGKPNAHGVCECSNPENIPVQNRARMNTIDCAAPGWVTDRVHALEVAMALAATKAELQALREELLALLAAMQGQIDQRFAAIYAYVNQVANNLLVQMDAKIANFGKRLTHLEGERVNVYFGPGADFFGRGSDIGGNGHGTFLIEGGPGGSVGMYGLGQLGVSGTKEMGTVFEASAAAGVSIAFDKLEQYKLLLGVGTIGWWRERDTGNDSGAIGNGLGWAVGLDASVLIQATDFFALRPFAFIGGGRYSGWDGDKNPFVQAGPVYRLGLDLLFGGEVYRAEEGPAPGK